MRTANHHYQVGYYFIFFIPPCSAHDVRCQKCSDCEENEIPLNLKWPGKIHTHSIPFSLLIFPRKLIDRLIYVYVLIFFFKFRRRAWKSTHRS